MLTGDKLETAENIARSCNLVTPKMNVFYLRENNLIQLKQNMDSYEQLFEKTLEKSMIIEGHSLRHILSESNATDQFLRLIVQTNSVVCCRATPKQKAEMVKLIRTREKKITLAIGDGANDCNMIQEANVGVGIYGNEGMRAVMTGDFAIGEFQCLWKLLFVHGRMNYVRQGNMILYFFYKNMLFTMP